MSKNTQEQNQGGQYGLLSMIAIIVGTVLGSGIFIKNQSLMDDSGSVILTSITWILGGIVVVSMMLAFLEVSSITKLKNEQGTFTNWSKRLYGPMTSKFIGVYFTLIYFPLVLASEGVFAGQKLTEVSLFSDFVNGKAYINWLIITIIAYATIAFAFLINIIWVKPGKAFASTISIVKLIPLLTVILGAIILFFGIWTDVSIGEIDSLNPVFDPNNEDFNSGLEGFGKSLETILLIMPGVMFAFDGFLYANSMSTETKKPNTYKNAAIISIAIITTVYLLFSLSTFLIAPLGPEGYDYTISGIINAMFPSLQFIADMLIFMIFLSITSATFGYAISSQWSFADASDQNLVKDEQGLLIRRNTVGNPYKAGWIMLIFAIISTSLFRFGDFVAIASIGDAFEMKNSTEVTDFISDFYSLLNFGLYSAMIFGVLLNRFTNKNEVEKVKGFFVFASIALVVVGLTTIVFGYDIIVNGIILNLLKGINNTDSIIALIQVLTLITLITIYSVVVVMMLIRVSQLTPEQQKLKDVYKHGYEKRIEYTMFSDALNKTKDKEYKDVYERIDNLHELDLYASNKGVSYYKYMHEIHNSKDNEFENVYKLVDSLSNKE